MTLTDRLAEEGRGLFRWRSFLPLAFLPVMFLALPESQRLHGAMGETWHYIALCGGLVISLFGLAIRWFTVGFVPARTSGRNTHEQRADVLNTAGIYSVVRNPLYLGNFFVLFGLVLFLAVWWLALSFCLAYWLYIERIIIAEERFLVSRFGDAYTGWAQATPCFVPRLSGWVPAERPFSLKTVLRREYNGVMGVALAFTSFEFIGDVIYSHQPVAEWIAEDRPVIALLAAGTVTFLVLRFLKKYTSTLHVEGR